MGQSQSLRNRKIRPNATQNLQKKSQCYANLQNFIKHDKPRQNFYNTLHNFTKLYNNYTQLYKKSMFTKS